MLTGGEKKYLHFNKSSDALPFGTLKLIAAHKHLENKIL